MPISSLPLGLRRTFRSLRSYNYRLYWFGLLFSMAGSWMQTVGQAWLVLDLTGSPLSLGSVVALQYLPMLVLSIPAGVIIDRLPKRRLIMATQGAAMLQSLVLGLLALFGLVQLWHIYVLAFLLGLNNAFDNPARHAFVSEMVAPEDVPNAVGLNSTLLNSARTIGPALGGLALATVGPAGCFLTNAASFLAVLLALALMRPRELRVARRSSHGPLLAELVEGVRFIRQSPPILLPLLLMGVIGVLGYNFTVTLPLLARFQLGSDALGYGALTSAMGLGALGGALISASLQSATWPRIVTSAAAFSLLEIGVALSPWYSLSLALLAGLGFASMIFATGVNTTLQLGSPARLRGRVLSFYTVLWLGSTPIGGVLTGGLADLVGVGMTLLIEALVCALAVALVSVLAARAKGQSVAIAPALGQGIERPSGATAESNAPPLSGRGALG